MSNNLGYKKQTVYEKANEAVVKAAFEYAEDYKKYLDGGKTEREALKISIEMAKSKGFREYRFGDKISVGDKLYYTLRDGVWGLWSSIYKSPLSAHFG